MNPNASLSNQFAAARRELLELSTANRLLNTKRDTVTGAAIEIKEESSSEIFKQLVAHQRTMRFEEGELVDAPEATPSGDSSSDSSSNESSGDGETATTKPRRRRTVRRRVATESQPVDIHDDILHTVLEPDDLDRRLNRLVTDSNAVLQEQGVNVLYLALGFLRWYEPQYPDLPRHAPLLLIPVKLTRGRGGARYSLAFLEDDITTNITLQNRMSADFGIRIPDLPENIEETDPADYFGAVARSVAGERTWEVLPNDVVLWFFSFSKLLMYRDLDPETWRHGKKLEERPLIKALLQDGFQPAEPLADNVRDIDPLFDPAQTLHVIDADSSQALVIEEATRGRSLVIQGPPGTGKSQTITNLIAESVAAGKTILFVSEKMAALEVVKRRLDNIGLGEMVLELHSNKTNKKALLAEIDRTLKQGTPQVPRDEKRIIDLLRERRDQLNHYAQWMHTPVVPKLEGSGKDNGKDNGQGRRGGATDGDVYPTKRGSTDGDVYPTNDGGSPATGSGLTPYQVLTELIELRANQTPLPDFEMPESLGWTRRQFEDHRARVAELASVIHQIGDPAQHPWRGSEIDSISPMDLDRVLKSAPQRLAELDAVVEAGLALSQRLGEPPATSLQQLQQLANTIETFEKAPPFDAAHWSSATWTDHRQNIQELADHARNILLAKEKLSDTVTDSAWDQSVAEDFEAYAKHGNRFFRMFSGAYRKARNTLKSLLRGSQPATFESRCEILERLHQRQQGLKTLAESNILGERAFGKFWLGLQTDWRQIADWEAWDSNAMQKGVLSHFRQLYQRYDDPSEIGKLASELRQKLDTFYSNFKSLTGSLKMDLDQAYQSGQQSSDSETDSSARLGNASLAPSEEIRTRIENWIANPERLEQWQTYRRAKASVDSLAGGALTSKITHGSIKADQAESVFRFAYAESLLREIQQQHPELEAFDGTTIEKWIDEFCDYDIERIELARSEIAKAHWDWIGRPRGDDMASEVNTLRHEMQKQRRHKPIRILLKESGRAIQAVKPVFMMSPISVAQYLEPGGLEFDMLLIDEASQVRPVEALGAAARCQQMIVVGDDKQMPPTSFFDRTIGEVDDEQPEMVAGDVESILGLAIARNMPQRMLLWHYRSKHESLIAVSNREFYDNRLYVIPSPERFGELGVHWTFVEKGKFLKGKNEIEAEVVARAIMQHAKDHPRWTLGVAAFSVSQRDAILHHLEKLRREDGSCEAFFDPNHPDPFFIKNLENVQGDERDVIFVSVGYGPGEDGRVALNFGPVSNSGGERRLNVLMTRAKRVLRIFSSMKAEDIDLNRATGRGPAVFREYLRYAQDRQTEQNADGSSVLPSQQATDRLAAVIKQELEQRGYSVATHVGIAGIYVDVAVLDPQTPGRCLVGVSLDGQQYHEARWARDRNRTSDGVLGGQGWVIHHVWSPDWFRKPQEQMNKLLEVIEAAQNGRATPKGARLASNVSKIERIADGLDPLAKAVGTLQPVPAKTKKSTRAEVAAAESKTGFWSVVKKFLASVWRIVWEVIAILVDQLDKATKNRSGKKTSSRKKKK